MASYTPFYITVEYRNPRTDRYFKKVVGPVYGKKAANEMLLLVMKKRNVVGASTRQEK